MKIRNNSTYVNSTGMQRATYEFYTSNDAETKLGKEDEYYYRIYYEGVDTFKNGGYVLFDTFTYDNEHLPRLKHYFPDWALTSTNPETGEEKYFGNYGCFNREHFPKFMKDLRADLADNGFDVAENLRFCFVTEYGHEDVYIDRHDRERVGTMRPHYHAMFFVTDVTLPPEVLNRYITKHWFYGWHENGHSRAKLLHNTFDSGLNAIDRKVRLRGLANYIGKYMHKDNDYEEVIGSRIDAIAFKMCPRPDFSDDRKGLKLLDDWRRRWDIVHADAKNKVSTFHRESLHFGERAIYEEEFDINEVAETGKLRIPDKDKVVKFLPIPMYYRRKLFYEQVRKDDGKLMWRLKDDDLSRLFDENKIYRQMAGLENVYNNIYSELSLQDRIKVDCWMNGRNMKDLAKYEVVYHDRYFDCDLEDIDVKAAIEIRQMQDFSASGLNGNEPNSGFPMHRIDQNSREDFAHFDEVLKVFEPYLDKRHKERNAVYRRKEQLNKSRKTKKSNKS